MRNFFKAIKFTKKMFVFLIVFLFFVFLLSLGYIYPRDEVEYGVTFSKKQAVDLGLDWREVYMTMLGDLGVRKLRLAAYWDQVEPSPGRFVWGDLDWMLAKASMYDAEIILAVGGRLPRWPECHFPKWADKLSAEAREQKILDYIDKTVTRYRDNQHIAAWQVENEPFLSHFGDCPKLNKAFLDREIALVRELDDRPVIITDSGELSVWVPAAKRADIFGTTMYRDTYSQLLKSYVHYPIKPGFFRFKKNVTSLFADPQKWVVIELQAEPWGPEPFQNLSREERDITMNPDKFRDIIEFSRQTGFREFYLWGVEWWFWECKINNRCELWQEARGIFGGK